MQGKARTFKAKTATLSLLGIADYDRVRQVEQLNPKVRDAINFSKKNFGTIDVEKIKRLMRLGIVREVSQIEGRKNAQLFQQKRDIAWNEKWDDDYRDNLTNFKSSAKSSESPDRSPSRMKLQKISMSPNRR